MRRRQARPRQGDVEEIRPIVDPVRRGEGEMTLHDLLMLYRRHWRVIAAILGLFVGGSLAYVTFATPVFTAQGQVVIERPAIQPASAGLMAAADTSIEDVPSEAARLRSRVLAGEVIRQLGLDQDAEFLDALDGDIRQAEGDKLEPLITVFLDMLDVPVPEASRVIDVMFTSQDPEKAANVVNTLMDRYIARHRADRVQRAEQAAANLENQVAQLRAEVVQAEQAVRDFRASRRLVESGKSDLTAERVSDLNVQVVAAEADLAALEAELSQIEAAVQRDGNAASAPRVINSRLIETLRDKEVELAREQAEMTTRLGPKHPSMVRIQNELADVRQSIGQEAAKIVDSVRREVAAAQARVESLRMSLNEQEGRAVESRGSESELAELEAEAASKRSLLNTFQVRLRDTQSQRDLMEAAGRIYSRAQVPLEPSAPQKGKVVAIAGFAGIVLALIVATVMGSLRRTLESADEVERLTRYRSLGIVPHLKDLAGGRRTALRVLEEYGENPHGPFSQTMKGVRSTVYLSNGSRAPKSILVTSAVPGEGKTTFALSYAALCAASGEKVVLLDCDFGRPDLHKKMDVANDLGVANYLMGEVDLDMVLRHDERLGLDYIPTGTLLPSSTELARSTALKSLLETLTWDYDLVLVDSAPVLSMSDSQVLSTLVDATVLVVQWRKTRTETMAAAVNRLDDLGVKTVAGFVLSNVDIPKSMAPEVASYYAAYNR